eukprot:2803836-Rhodomonas_salina.1
MGSTQGLRAARAPCRLACQRWWRSGSYRRSSPAAPPPHPAHRHTLSLCPPSASSHSPCPKPPAACQCGRSAGEAGIHREIKYKKPLFQHDLYQEC